MNQPQPARNDWDAGGYDATMNVVTRLGAGVVDLLEPRSGERILDLGCGTGHHAAEFAAAGCLVEGIDSSPAMIERAGILYPGLAFRVARGQDFRVDAPVDAVFSNAALHWMIEPEAVAARVFAALRPGGRFVGELGAKHNVERVLAALTAAIAEVGIARGSLPRPWYFPSPAEYATVLEDAGFEVETLQYFVRPTRLEEGDGLADWYRIFAGDFLGVVPAERRERVVRRAIELARPTQFTGGHWVVDYRRLRFRAVHPDT
ncbi:MAG: methyltransferase domain-containing protein [Dehalococcoidia bacterium]